MGAAWVTIARLADLAEDVPAAASVEGHEFVVIRHAGAVRVLSGRCPHRAAKLAEHGKIEGELLVCQRHGWDFRVEDGRPPQGGDDGLASFEPRVEADGSVQVVREAICAYARENPSAFRADEDVA